MNCMDEQEYDLTVPTNKRDLIHALKSSHPKQTIAQRFLSAETGQKRTFTQKFCIYKLYTLLAVQNHLVPTLF